MSETKKCNECNQQKSLMLFYKDKNSLGGLRPNCKECKDAKTIQWRNLNRERYNESARIHNRRRYPASRLQRYGLTHEEYQTMLINQNNRCAICKKLPQGKRPLVVDHHHETKEVRGLLCYGCNRAIAIFDNLLLLQACGKYLKKSL
jgi:Recombination endonuclease VII